MIMPQSSDLKPNFSKDTFARKQISLFFSLSFFSHPNITSSYEICPICNIYFPLFNNRKGFAALLLIFAFLIKILKGVLGELNQQKRRREKNSSCAVPRTCKQRKHAVCLRAADGRSSRSRVPGPSSDSFPSLSACLSCLQSGPNAMLSAKTMELVSMPLVRLGQIQTLMEHPACLSQEASVSPFCIVRLKN